MTEHETGNCMTERSRLWVEFRWQSCNNWQNILVWWYAFICHNTCVKFLMKTCNTRYKCGARAYQAILYIRDDQEWRGNNRTSSASCADFVVVIVILHTSSYNCYQLLKGHLTQLPELINGVKLPHHYYLLRVVVLSHPGGKRFCFKKKERNKFLRKKICCM